MDRRNLLRGALAFTLGAPTVIGSGFGEKNAPRAEKLTVDDNHASPFAEMGDVVAYDAGDVVLQNYGIYVTTAQTSGRPYVCRALLDTDGNWWVERFARRDVYGPMSAETLARAVNGRVRAVWKNVA